MFRSKSLACGIVAFFLATSVGVAAARDKESYCTWKDGITPERIAVSDAWLFTDGDPRIAAALAEHLPFGMPSGIGDDGSGEHLLAQPHFVIWYDDDLRAPLWTAHHLTRFEASVTPPKQGDHGAAAGEARRDSFRSDPRIPASAQSQCRDYEEPIFDQGHMVPNGDLDFITPGMDWSLGMDHSFLMSNMTPQHCAFNRGPWQVLEGLIRDWVLQSDDTWIITGAIFDRDGVKGRDADADAWRMKGKDGDRRVAIPSALYKIVATWSGGTWKTLVVRLNNTDELIENGALKAYMAAGVTSLGEVSEQSGFGFFNEVAVSESSGLWPVHGKWPTQLTSRCRPSYPEK